MRKLLLASVASMGALLAAGAANAQPLKPVAPGTIVTHVNGYFQFGMDDVGSSASSVGGNKLNPVTTNGEFRLYPRLRRRDPERHRVRRPCRAAHLLLQCRQGRCFQLHSGNGWHVCPPRLWLYR